MNGMGRSHMRTAETGGPRCCAPAYGSPSHHRLAHSGAVSLSTRLRALDDWASHKVAASAVGEKSRGRRQRRAENAPPRFLDFQGRLEQRWPGYALLAVIALVFAVVYFIRGDIGRGIFLALAGVAILLWALWHLRPEARRKRLD